jgi:hypothetical protein
MRTIGKPALLLTISEIIVVDIGYPVCIVDDQTLQRRRAAALLVIEYAVAHLKREVKSDAVLQFLHHAQALLVVLKAPGQLA